MSKNHEVNGDAGKGNQLPSWKRAVGDILAVTALGSILGGCSAGAEGPCQQPPAATAEAGPSSDNQLSPKEYERVNGLATTQLTRQVEKMSKTLSEVNLPYGEPVFDTVDVWEDSETGTSGYTSIGRSENSLRNAKYIVEESNDGGHQETVYKNEFTVTPLLAGSQLRFTEEKVVICRNAARDKVSCPGDVVEWSSGVNVVIPTYDKVHHNDLTPALIADLIGKGDMRFESISKTRQDGGVRASITIKVDKDGGMSMIGNGVPGIEDLKRRLVEDINNV